ncbi:hypothetical protein [Streptomyces sp. NPDC058371]|uniref:hypothetical protein n=1 Tax=Streptomyces sp. NPDC058371 TaxID=3346463 RepID=UPI003650ECE0
MLSNKPVRQLAATAVAVAALAVSLAACDSNEQSGKSQEASAPTTLCGANLTTGTREALLDVLGSRTYDWEWQNLTRLGDIAEPDPKNLGEAAEQLVSGYHENGADDSATAADYDLCWVNAPKADRGVKLSFHLRETVPISADLSPKFTQYKMGELAFSRPLTASLIMKCSNSKFGSTGKPVLIEGELTNPLAVESKDETLRAKNLNVLHAVSLAMAKELGCKDDAGLPAKFSVPQEATPAT